MNEGAGRGGGRGGRGTSGSDTKRGQYGAKPAKHRLEAKNSTWQRNVNSYCTAIQGWTALNDEHQAASG